MIISFVSCAQQINDKELIGEWKGELTDSNDILLDMMITLKGEDAIFKLSKDKNTLTHKFKLGNTFKVNLDDNVTFKGELNRDKSQIEGFMVINRNLYPVKLVKKGNEYFGKSNLSILHHLKSNNLRLNIKEVNENGYTIYPMFGTFWVSDFKQEKNNLSFKDYKTGLKFEGQLKSSEMIFDVSLAGSFIARTVFKKSGQDKVSTLVSSNEKVKMNDGWESSKNPLVLSQMETDIKIDSLVGVEGVLVARKGKIVYENYFSGFEANIPHTMMSASKSISSAIIGVAIDDKIFSNVDEKLYNFIPQEYQYTKDSLKSEITIRDLLTMSSGLDVNNKAFEDNYQESNNWLKTVLEAPMVKQPGTYADYGSANPFLLGVVLHERLDIPLEVYMEEKFFSPLGITNYIMNVDDTGVIPYFGGGLNLTPRDMLKFGQLYLNGGVWNGQQIISARWVEESFKKHVQLQDRNKIEYGYLWWHDTTVVDGKPIQSVEARGAGGQRICIVPELETVVVITAGNFRNGKSLQSGKIFKEYILPALMN